MDVNVKTNCLIKNRGASLLVEAADMGDPNAQYELGCRLRVEVRLLFLKYFY